MDNEKKDLVNDDATQKMKEDVSNKIADAAAEIKDEIDEANQQTTSTIDGDGTESTDSEKLEDSFTEVDPSMLTAEVAKEKKSVNISVGALVGIIAGCVVIAALIAVLCMNFVGKNNKSDNLGDKIEGNIVATVDGIKITDEDLKYYIYAEAMTEYYDIEGQNATGDFSDFDWEQDVDGQKLSEKIKTKAYENALADVATISKGSESLSDEEKWTDTDDQQVQTTVNQYVTQFGEDGFTLRARSMGISSPNEYARMYKTVMRAQAVQSAMEEDTSKFVPDGVDLSNYVQDDKGSVKHILIKTTDGSVANPGATPDPDAVDDATGLATAKTVAEQAKSGTDFDQLMQQYNKDTGETSAGYTFKNGEMVEEFENAAFALKLNEISDPVKTSYGYHVIKRIPGLYELQGYWKDQVKVKETKKNLDNISVVDVMKDIQSATDELETEQAAQQQSAGSSATGSSAAGSSAAGN